jgi:electron transfer flavoprotein alpha subunit
VNRLRTVALVKQVPLGDPPLGADARLQREGGANEMNAWCRRAVAQAVRLGDSTAITMGPPSAVDVLLEAAAWGIERSVHVCDPALAGADCLVTARALAASVRALGAVDLILVGHSSTDGSTGAVGPMLAELLGLPFIGPAMEITVDDGTLHTTLQVEGGDETVAVRLPAVVAVAERSCPPCKAPPDTWPDKNIVEQWTTADLEHTVGRSPTAVTGMRHTSRDRKRLRFGPDRMADAVRALDALALTEGPPEADPVPPTTAERLARADRTILVVGNGSDEAGRRALLGELATLASGPVVSAGTTKDAGPWGADEHIVLRGTEPRPTAAALSDWIERTGMPWAIVGGSTWWDREVLARLAVRLDAGLMSDLTGVVLRDGRLVGDKPAGQGMLAEIVGTGPTQIATIRTGTLQLRTPRQATASHKVTLEVAPEPAITRLHHQADDDYDALDRADTVIGIGRGVRPDDYAELEPLRSVLGAEMAATRKVTDAGLMPHSRQLGVTARSIAPALYVAIGVQGNANHSIGVSRAHAVLAINNDPEAPIFDHSDVGIVGDWREVVPLLVAELQLVRAVRA